MCIFLPFYCWGIEGVCPVTHPDGRYGVWVFEPNNCHKADITISIPKIALLHEAVVISENPRIQGEAIIQIPKINCAQFKFFIRVLFYLLKGCPPPEARFFSRKQLRHKSWFNLPGSGSKRSSVISPLHFEHFQLPLYVWG